MFISPVMEKQGPMNRIANCLEHVRSKENFGYAGTYISQPFTFENRQQITLFSGNKKFKTIFAPFLLRLKRGLCRKQKKGT